MLKFALTLGILLAMLMPNVSMARYVEQKPDKRHGKIEDIDMNAVVDTLINSIDKH